MYRRRLTQRAEVADHVHVLALLRRDRPRAIVRRPTRLGAQRHERGHLDQRCSSGLCQKAIRSSSSPSGLGYASPPISNTVGDVELPRPRTPLPPRGTRRPPPRPGRTRERTPRRGSQPSALELRRQRLGRGDSILSDAAQDERARRAPPASCSSSTCLDAPRARARPSTRRAAPLRPIPYIHQTPPISAIQPAKPGERDEKPEPGAEVGRRARGTPTPSARRRP